MHDNLNHLLIRKDYGSQDLVDCSVGGKIDSVEAIFYDHEKKLISVINQYKDQAIFGCVAWLTSIPILKALAKCKNVQIIVQKEDFLRPDIKVKIRDTWNNELRQLYSDVSCSMTRYEFKKPICELSVCCDPSVEGIRCAGNFNSDKRPAFPRMHHKFLVFCKTKELPERTSYEPVAVWTGSFNFTMNATHSLENALLMTDYSGTNPIIQAYLKEHHQVFSISEQLDWTSEWVYPEYRIGT